MDGRRGQSMLAVPFICLYLRIFGSIQQFVCFDVLTVFKQAELQADKYQPLFLSQEQRMIFKFFFFNIVVFSVEDI